MRSSTMIPAFSGLFILLNIPTVIATPLATSLPLAALQYLEGNALEKRCANPCGSDNWLCCGASETCYTNSADQAACSTAGSDWEYFTTTYVVTEVEASTITSVWSSQVTTAAATTTTATCKADLGEATCGTTCCDAAEECVDGVCVAESSSAAVTGDATPAARGTSSGTSTATATAAATTTEGFIAPVSTDGSDLIGVKATSSGGLSGGAIAGIVIGTIAGVALLLLLCACCCFKEALDGLFAALGMGKRRKKQETIIDERYSHHSQGSRPRPQGGRTWFGTKPGATSEVSEKKSSWSSWGTVAVILGALALCLGLKRHKDREHDDDRTENSYPSSYYYYSEYTRTPEDELETHGGLDDHAHDHDADGLKQFFVSDYLILLT
ncbi:hypothetical protein N7490_008941 [Penicillium lividum]|nr:hypothetical protein N7490_008941 [Penicillium lividum]